MWKLNCLVYQAIAPPNLLVLNFGGGTMYKTDSISHERRSVRLCMHMSISSILITDYLGAFGKVFRGTLKTSLPGRGLNGTSQRDVAVKTLKSESCVVIICVNHVTCGCGSVYTCRGFQA